jgi:pimeloyl-ACP methyl ester carboxylesterase
MRIVVNHWALCVVLAALACLPLQAQVEQKKQSLEGIWLGPLKIGKQELRIAFHLTETDGKLSAKMDSLDQGAKGLAIPEATFEGGVVRLASKGLNVAFEGKLNKDATEIAGDFKQGPNSFPLTLKRVDKLPAPNRPQEPKRPFPYREEEITFENKKAKAKFAGTLTLPKGSGGPFAAVLLITGSGLQNRDEEIFDHKPFLLIADYLTRRGLAVLRVDDRSVGGSTGDVSRATTADFAEDIEAGVEYLKSRKDIDATQIGLIGHSEGGVIAPIVASRSKDIAFIVLLAGSGVTGEELLLEQNRLVMNASGAKKLAVEVQLKLLGMVMPIVKKEADPQAAQKLVLEEFARLKEKASDEEKKELTVRENSDLKTLVKQLSSPWFRYFLMLDPRPSLRKVQCPVLALIGQKDLQVPPKMNLNEIAKALKEGGNKDFACKEMPNVNHLFQTCKTGRPTEYPVIEETMAPVVLETMANWILERVKK